MSEALKNSGKPVRFVLIGVAAMLLGGCADSSRLGDPFADPFQKSARIDRNPTGTVAQPQQSQNSNFFTEAFRPFGDNSSDRPARPPADVDQPHYAPQRSSAIQSQPLAPPRAAAEPWSAPKPASVPAPSVAALRSAPTGIGGWSAEGGTPIVVAQGENADMIAQRFGVPTPNLLSLNGFNNRAQVQPGARLVIPVYHANGARSAAMAPAEPRAVQAAHVEAPKAAPVMKQARAQMAPKFVATPTPQAAAALTEQRAKTAQVKAADATRKTAEAKLQAQPAQGVKAQPVQTAQATKAKQDKLIADAKKLAAAKPAAPVATKQVASAAPAPVQPAVMKFEKPQAPAAPAVDTAATASVQPSAGSVASASAGDAANPEFRWPARGRVIQAFGAGGNDGINIAVPEGTQVKAAEGGTVAYAGSELKGYGNLVLIRHPNGFVSAYANNGSINVKRGDTVKRGQTIALSGQSGNVASPQLHFELRKGSKPVDPSSYLAGL